eukprot:3946068-Prymnesium_polylepis.1
MDLFGRSSSTFRVRMEARLKDCHRNLLRQSGSCHLLLFRRCKPVKVGGDAAYDRLGHRCQVGAGDHAARRTPARANWRKAECFGCAALQRRRPLDEGW